MAGLREPKAFHILPALVPLAVACAALAGCETKARTYEEEILAARAEKDRAFREAADSPIPPERRASWPPLVYFPVDESYRVPAALEPAQNGETIVVPTSTGERRPMRRAGTLAFTLKGRRLRLTAFVDPTARGPLRLFVPFADLTNGTETYPGGRYLDLDPTPTGIYDLDFNRAYNPYCAYNPSYDCPFPPAENRLPLPVRAGEKLPPA
ncbi:MAG TPA: DUF1684 domain-containing protein [Vicinamibacterales bacterium]|nr:DUF1684 domain-containing protein [Vicinamibacterales bacterium]